MFLPGESHGRRSLVGYSPRGREESDRTSLMGLLLHHPFSSHSGQSSVFVQASHSGPQNPTNLRTASVYSSSTYQTVFCVIFLPHPPTATMYIHFFPTHRYTILSREILWKSIPAAGCLAGGCLLPGGGGYWVAEHELPEVLQVLKEPLGVVR